MELYDRKRNKADADDIYAGIITGTAGVGGDNAFVNPYHTSVPSGGEGGIGSALLDLVLMNTVGIRNPFRLPSWSEPAAGGLGAYAYSRFSDNARRMGTAAGLQKEYARRAMGSIIAFNPATSVVYDGDTEGQAALREAVARGDQAGFTDLGTAMFQQLFGLEDFGVAGVRAAQRSEGLLQGRLRSGGGSAILTDRNTISDNWRSREASVVGEYAREANRAMYESGTFIRNEDFMRGFSETDVSSVLERVAATAHDGEDLSDRFNDLGKSAMRTLEAFRDLFGSAEDAKKMLNQITGGGWGGLKSTDLDSLTNQVRGLQNLGSMQGLNHREIGNMLAIGAVGVQGAMGYTAEDVAGGYVNQALVNGISQTVLANELANSGSMDLDPINAQRMKARALWRATQFAGSSAAKAMTAFEFAVQKGVISEEDQGRIRSMFESGDTKNMGTAAKMVADALNIKERDIYDDTNFKLFSESVGNDTERRNELLNMGAAAMANEDRVTMEKQLADTGLDMASRYAKENGVDSKTIGETAAKARLDYVKQTLRENSGQAGASALLAMIEKEEQREGGTASSAYNVFKKFSSDLENTEFAATIETNAQAAAANSVIDLAERETTNTRIALDNVSDGVKSVLKDRGVDIDKGLRRSDATKILTAFSSRLNSGVAEDAAWQKRIAEAKKDPEKMASVISDLFGSAGGEYEDILGNAIRNITFEKEGGPERVQFSSKLTGNQIADAFSEGVSVKRIYTNGAGGTIDDISKIQSGMSAMVDFLASDEVLSKLPDDAARAAYKARLADIKKNVDSGSEADLTKAAEQVDALKNDKAYSQVLGRTDVGNTLDYVLRLSDDAEAADTLEKLSSESVLKKVAANDKVLVGRTEMTRDTLHSVVKEAAAGIDAFSGLEGKDLIDKIGEFNAVIKSAESDESVKGTEEYAAAEKAITELNKGLGAQKDKSGRNLRINANDIAESKGANSTGRVEDLQSRLEKIQAGLFGEDATEDTKAAARIELAQLLGEEKYSSEFSGIAPGGEFAGAGAFSFATAFAQGANGAYTDVVTVGDKKFKRSELDSIVEKSAEGIDAFKDEDGKTLSGADIYKKISELQETASGSGEEADAAKESLNALYSNMRASGELATAALDEETLGGVLGTVAKANVANDDFGGALVAADKLSASVKDLGSKAVVTTDDLEELGKKIQGIVDVNAPAAYTTMQQAVITGLSGKGWDSMVNLMMKPGATEEEKAAAIDKVLTMLGNEGVVTFKKDESGEFITDESGNKVIDTVNMDKLAEAVAKIPEVVLGPDETKPVTGEDGNNKDTGTGQGPAAGQPGSGGGTGAQAGNAEVVAQLIQIAENSKKSTEAVVGIKENTDKLVGRGTKSDGADESAPGEVSIVR